MSSSSITTGCCMGAMLCAPTAAGICDVSGFAPENQSRLHMALSSLTRSLATLEERFPGDRRAARLVAVASFFRQSVCIHIASWPVEDRDRLGLPASLEDSL